MTQIIKNDRKLRVVFPKKGRLKQDFKDILEKAGIQVQSVNDRLDYSAIQDAGSPLDNIEVLNQRSGDAIDNLNIGLADMAIVGLDTYEEKRCEAALRGSRLNTRIVVQFNIASCGLYIAAPPEQNVTEAKDLSGKRIATSYPNTLRKWLAVSSVKNVEIIARDGGIEDYVRLGAADMVCDVVDTGDTLKANKLTPRIKLFNSTAVLIQRTGEWTQDNIAQANALKERLTATTVTNVDQPILASEPKAAPPTLAI